MVVQGTTETEAVLTSARYCRYYSVELSLLDSTLYSVLAVRRRTPLQIVFVVDIGTGEKDLISGVKSVQVLKHQSSTYLDFNSAATSMSRDFESTILLHPLVGHCILAASPSSLIF